MIFWKSQSVDISHLWKHNRFFVLSNETNQVQWQLYIFTVNRIIACRSIFCYILFSKGGRSIRFYKGFCMWNFILRFIERQFFFFENFVGRLLNLIDTYGCCSLTFFPFFFLLVEIINDLIRIFFKKPNLITERIIKFSNT